MNNELADILRIVAMGQAAVIALMTIWTIIRYARKAHAALPHDRALPIHVAVVALSYLLLAIYVVGSLYARVGDLPTWRIPVALTAFTLGVVALGFMVSHLSARRVLREILARKVEAEANKEILRQIERTENRMQRMEKVGQYTHDAVKEMQEDDTIARAEVAQSLENVGKKADNAYHEANAINEKLASSSEEVSVKLSDIKNDAEAARRKAVEAVAKAEIIDETGKDTNARVRRIEPKNQT